MNTNTIKRLIIVHQGALGDFLMIWPTLAGLRRALPRTEFLWTGSSERLPLLHPLQVRPAPAGVRHTIRALYGDGTNKAVFQADEPIIWFYLRKKPFQIKHENIFFLKGIDQDDFTSPRIRFAAGLETLGIPFDPNWQATFQRAFPRCPADGPQKILLFPGSGNPAKNWPLVQFFELGARLEDLGFRPIMVLGPVEQECGIRLSGNTDTACPQTIRDLIALLQQAACVVGNDSGPLHLAGYMGIPGLAIFGPTSPTQWGPVGLDILSLDLPCSPCTQTARIACTDPVCITRITVDQVLARLTPRLARISPSPKNETGS